MTRITYEIMTDLKGQKWCVPTSIDGRRCEFLRKYDSGFNHKTVDVTPEEWISYLKDCGVYDIYDGLCDCYVCRHIREDFGPWMEQKKSPTPPQPEKEDV